MWSAARSAKISMILCMPERVSGGDAKFQGFCDGWNKWEGQADIDPSFMKQVLNLPQRQRKSDIHHHCQADNLGRANELAEWIAHCRRLRNLARTLKPIYSDKAVKW